MHVTYCLWSSCTEWVMFHSASHIRGNTEHNTPYLHSDKKCWLSEENPCAQGCTGRYSICQMNQEGKTFLITRGEMVEVTIKAQLTSLPLYISTFFCQSVCNACWNWRKKWYSEWTMTYESTVNIPWHIIEKVMMDQTWFFLYIWDGSPGFMQPPVAEISSSCIDIS